MQNKAVLVSAVRTPVGRCRGSLSSVPAAELGALVLKESINRAGIEPAEIDDVVFGNLFNREAANMARYIVLTAGLPCEVPGVTIDRQCASSLNALAYAAAMIQAGYNKTMVAGGVESDSRRTYVMEKAETAYQVIPPALYPAGACGPGEHGVSMGITAENIAKRYGLTRAECDAFAAGSHRKAAQAWAEHRFDSQLIPVPARKGKETVLVDKDEIVRPDTTPETLAALKPAFLPDGVVTAGNSSPLSDGAGAAVMMDYRQAVERQMPHMYAFSGFAAAGVDPQYMGLGPIMAVKKLFAQTGMTLKDIDLVELNEAFAAQALACVRDLDIPEDKLNVNGGAIALGHPLGGTGAVLTAKMMYELTRRGLTTGLITFCIGGGQGAACILERIR